MNCIKEQATINVVAKDVQSYETGFEAGANFVLDVIQDYVITKHFNLEDIIEKLKE